jgi:hypothetical protein
MPPPASSALKESFQRTGCALSLRSIENLDQSEKSEGTGGNAGYDGTF